MRSQKLVKYKSGSTFKLNPMSESLKTFNLAFVLFLGVIVGNIKRCTVTGISLCFGQNFSNI